MTRIPKHAANAPASHASPFRSPPVQLETVAAPDPIRLGRLNKVFDSVTYGNQSLGSSEQGKLFIEALCVQPDSSACIEKIIGRAGGLQALQTCMRLTVSNEFLNGPAVALLDYLRDPGLKLLCEGDYLKKVLTRIADPPIFWNAFARTFREGSLNEPAQHAFAWLLLELLSLPNDVNGPYVEIAQTKSVQDSLLGSARFEIRVLAQQIKKALDLLEGSLPSVPNSGRGPGGRHDNDFADFRQILLMPTADELTSTEPAYMLTAEIVDGIPDAQERALTHQDNQFRMLREDMNGEMREELQIALKIKSGKHRGLIVHGLTLHNMDCGTAARRKPWTIRLKCKDDIPQLHNAKPDRKSYIVNNRNFVKRNSLACLLADGAVIGFPTIDRDEDLLAEQHPIFSLKMITAESEINKALFQIKTAKKISMVQIDTAIFSFAPVLRRLQLMKIIPLADQLLFATYQDSENKSPIAPEELVSRIMKNGINTDLQSVLRTSASVKLDGSQTASLLAGLTKKVSLIQGPPGTGKSFIGALLAKALHDHTSKTILVVCYTNHALDQFLEDLLKIGIPNDSMVRLGGKSTTITQPLSLKNQTCNFRGSKAISTTIDHLKQQCNHFADLLHKAWDAYKLSTISKSQLLEHLEFEIDGPPFYEAFKIPLDTQGMTRVGKSGKKMDNFYLLDRWMYGRDAGTFQKNVTKYTSLVWQIRPAERRKIYEGWINDVLKNIISGIGEIARNFNKAQDELDCMFKSKNRHIISNKRIIGCTTTGAAMYADEMQAASPDIVLVEEAGEILESHVLTALGKNTEQLILIGDHKQLRPKISNFNLGVEKGDGFDLNRSLFERLILKGFPHEVLNEQHRMRPEISSLVRHLTYPDLVDAEKTTGRPNIRGFQKSVIFVDHRELEGDLKNLSAHSMESTGLSKQNMFEADMVLKCVRYLGQQGYRTDEIVILTPYLGQLQLLRTMLSKYNDPVLNDLDSHDLVQAGLLPAATAKLGKNPIHLATIDNYQGEEKDIVIASLTRSNSNGDIGFMSAPERLNVLLSRARNGLIMIGNAETFRKSRRGKDTWCKFFDLLIKLAYIHEGFPIKCERHPDRLAMVSRPDEFKDKSPDGGCTEPCTSSLNCGVHKCPQRCHQLADHSKIKCQEVLRWKCSKGHQQSRKCHQAPSSTCTKCDKEDEIERKKQQDAFELQQKMDEAAKAHEKQMSKLDSDLAIINQQLKAAQLSDERKKALLQKQRDVEAARARVVSATDSDASQPPVPDGRTSFATEGGSPMKPSRQAKNPTKPEDGFTSKPIKRSPPKQSPLEPSPAKEEWERQKRTENASNTAIDALMEMIGLENVKDQVLSIKAKVEVYKRQGTDLKSERFHVALLGNPGTGKTTVARHYAKFLTSEGVLSGDEFIETTGSAMSNDGVPGAKKHLETILKAGGGSLFIDEAYQLAASIGGKQILDFLLTAFEDYLGKLVIIIAGYNKEMESFFEHNPGFDSRVPYRLQFTDYNDKELLSILQQLVQKKFQGKMRVEDDLDGLYMRIVARRLGRSRGRPGFGNARALQTEFSRITGRQAKRITKERKEGLLPDDFVLTNEDLIGPDPSTAIIENDAWARLQKLIGLEDVKNAVKNLINGISENYKRDLEEKGPLNISLNRVFIGSPGTGKTSVAKLYGQILADLALLSNGEVVTKNPSDFVGSALGQSEENTKKILANTVGKVLIIDEAYMLYPGNSSISDPYKTAVIDTIVAEVQSVPGDDRCVLLLGYKDQMEDMFNNVNPGLSRRFPIEDAFNFQDFTDEELSEILELKLGDADLEATDKAKTVAVQLLSRKRNKPNFGNAGEVENLLSQAKGRFIRSLNNNSNTTRSQLLQPEHFDPDFDRGQNASKNLKDIFKDVIGCEEIISKLEGYQNAVANMRSRGIDPRSEIPTNFIFKGPPGTGKTSTARKIGQVYYDMGLLAGIEVLEKSASDLIGQYVGETAQKTHKQLELALGKVILVDEAYRLGTDGFGTEAINELVDTLTKPKFHGKLIVILAGYENDMNQFLQFNAGLSSRFTETIIFPNMSIENCLKILDSELQKKSVAIPVVQDLEHPLNQKVRNLLYELSSLPSWGNARDIQTLGKKITNAAYRSTSSTDIDSALTIPTEETLAIFENMLAERRNGSEAASSGARVPTADVPKMKLLDRSNISTKPTIQATQLTSEEVCKEEPETSSANIAELQERDDGVSDSVWYQLQLDKLQEAEAVKQLEESVREQAAQAEAAKAQLEAAAAELKAEQDRKAADDEELEEFKRRQEAARIKELEARRARDETIARAEKARAEEKRFRAIEQHAQQKLREMGVCEAGFKWIRQTNGYRCAGGAHFVSNGQLGI